MAGLDSYVKLLLHCNGTDGSTSFPDASESAHTVTANDNAQVDTAQSKFGGASGLFDGTGDYLSVPDSADWDFGSGNFTIDMWIRPTDVIGPRIIYSHSDVITLAITIGSTLECGFTGWSFAGGTVTVNVWQHIALVRNGNTWKLYLDGVNVGTYTESGAVDITSAINIGRRAIPGDYYFVGWIEEIRISKGIARWTSDFTPPTDEYYIEIDSTLSESLPSFQLAAGGFWSDFAMMTFPQFTTNTYAECISTDGYMYVPLLTTNAELQTGAIGTGEMTLPVLTTDSKGPDTGDLAQNIPMMTLEGNAFQGNVGTAELDLDTVPTISGNIIPGTVGNMTSNLPKLSLSAYTALKVEIDLIPLSVSAEGYSGTVSGMEVTTPSMLLSGAALIHGFGSCDMDLTSLVVSVVVERGDMLNTPEGMAFMSLYLSSFGYSGNVGSCSATMPKLTASTEHLKSGTGSSALVLPKLRVESTLRRGISI